MLYKEKSSYFLAIHVNIQNLLLFFEVQADHIAFDVPKSNDGFIQSDIEAADVVVMVPKLLLRVEHVSNVPR